MSEIKGWYYLHENKDLIYKNDPSAISDIRDSDFCLSAWAWDDNRETAWTILIEALSLGANKDRIKKLTKLWECTDTDALRYANSLKLSLGEDGNQKTAYGESFVDLQESNCGFGDTYLEAMADLCKQLGYCGGKLWAKTFSDLLT